MEWLKAILGDSYTDEIADKIKKQIGKDFVARADFNDVNEAKKALEDQLKERDKQLEELKKIDAEGLKAKIEELQKVNETAKSEYEAQLAQVKKNAALETRLIKDGAVNVKAVLALLDTEKISLDGENLIGYDDQIKALKESEKWAFQEIKQPKTGEYQTPGGEGEKTLADEIKTEIFGQKG